MTMPMPVTWATDYFGLGNAYGYSLHNRHARAAIQRAGVTLRADAAVAIHVCPAHLFAPIPGRRNILYTAWETEDLPPRFVAQIRRADAVVVTASFLLPVMRRCVPEVPAYLCPLGVEAAAFPACRRRRELGRPFRFLWVGAPNARKGWELILQAWRVFAGDRRFELYLKTTVTAAVTRVDNVIFDSRDYSRAELAALYRSAHAFLFPSFGEGFGLTMAEAMATGLPVIFTPWSSLTDLADESCAYPLRYRLIDAWATDAGGLLTRREAARAAGGVATRLAQADVVHLVQRMGEVAAYYPRAVKKGWRAACRIRARFSWERTGRTLAAIAAAVAGEAAAPADDALSACPA